MTTEFEPTRIGKGQTVTIDGVKQNLGFDAVIISAEQYTLEQGLLKTARAQWSRGLENL